MRLLDDGGGVKEVERGRIEKYGLENIGWGMMVKRKPEQEKVVIVNGKKIGGWIVRVGIAAVVGGECGGHPEMV